MSKATILRMTEDERDVLLSLLSIECAGAVHAIVTAPSLDPKSKTNSIIQKLDWVFDLRHTLRNIPSPTGVVWLNDFSRWYCDKLLAEAEPELFPLEQRARFYQAYRSLKPKITDVTGVVVEDEQLKPDPKVN